MIHLFCRALCVFTLALLLYAPPAEACEQGRSDDSSQDQTNTQTSRYDGPKENLHVYLLIGQSNMAGRAKVPEDMAGVIDRCYLLNEKNEWVPAKNPLNLYSSIRKGEGMQKLGPGYSFALAMLEANPDIFIGLVVNARGGSKIEQWGRKTNYYLQAELRTKAAMQTGTLKGILWHQGESNSSRPRSYLRQLTTLITDLRVDFERDDLPFVAGQIRDDDKSKPINTEIAKLPEAVPYTGVALSEGLTMYDGTHFDTESQFELGKRYAKQILALQKQAAEQDTAVKR